MLSVVVPTFNEGKNIRNLVTQIDDALKGIDYEILFVDDSKDNTPDVIREVAKDFPQIRLEHRTGETGLATAVLKGFELAKGEYMACMDADLQHPPIVLKYMYRLWKAVLISVYQAVLYLVEMTVDLTGTESSYLAQQER
jgi:dolichol-phosphate mannosyltransferase